MNPPFDPPPPDPEDLEAAAVEHFARARSGDPAATQALEQWLVENPSHRAAYAEVEDLWDELEPLRASETVRAALAHTAEPQAETGRRRSLVALAASIALIVGVAGLSLGMGYNPFASISTTQPQRTYATSVGEVARIALADGTAVVLDTDSAMTVSIGTRGERDVTVSRGRAWFDVAKMPDRPFIVQAGSIAVLALGTRFDVYRQNRGIEVNLVEGRLRVEQKPGGASPHGTTIEMAAGERLQAQDEGRWTTSSISGKSVGWMEGELTFDNIAIGTIARELNRYSKKKIAITDPVLSEYKISAVFRTSDPSTFLDALETTGIAKTRRTANGYIVEPRIKTSGDREGG